MKNISFRYFCMMMSVVFSTSLLADGEKHEHMPQEEVDLFELESEKLYPGKILSLEKDSGLLSMYIREYPERLIHDAPVKYNVRFRVLQYDEGAFQFLAQEKIKTIYDWRDFKNYTDGYEQSNMARFEQELFTKEFTLKDGRGILVNSTKVDVPNEKSYIQLVIDGAVQKITTFGILYFADVYQRDGHLKLLLASTYCGGSKRCSDSLMVLNIRSEGRESAMQALLDSN